MQATPTKPRGFTLPELFTVLAIISVTAALLFPVVTNCGVNKERLQRNQCMSNLKQIGLALLMYAQDNDATLPPANFREAGTQRLQTTPHSFGKSVAVSPPSKIKWRAVTYWLGYASAVAFPGTPSVKQLDMNSGGYLSRYFKNSSVVRCPTVTQSIENSVYMTNDLASGASLLDFANPAVTVAAMDGEAAFPSTGHSYEPTARLNTWLEENREQKGSGAVGTAAKRHNGGAGYLLADGHVKWFKPEAVFFPPRDSTSQAHYDPARREFIGPNPGGPMDLTGTPFQATFHLW